MRASLNSGQKKSSSLRIWFIKVLAESIISNIGSTYENLGEHMKISARNMLKDGVSIQLIRKYTGLKQSQILKLKKEKLTSLKN